MLRISDDCINYLSPLIHCVYNVCHSTIRIIPIHCSFPIQSMFHWWCSMCNIRRFWCERVSTGDSTNRRTAHASYIQRSHSMRVIQWCCTSGDMRYHSNTSHRLIDYWYTHRIDRYECLDYLERNCTRGCLGRVTTTMDYNFRITYTSRETEIRERV